MSIRIASHLIMLLSVTFTANASSSNNWDTFSDIGVYGLVGAALSIPAYKDDWEGFRQAGYSIATASGVGLLGKSLIEEERPDNSGSDSFPSNHSANAFAAATTLNRRYGWKFGVPAYGIASLVGIGRVQAEKHYWKDVLAGAVIGSLAGWAFTEPYNDIIQITSWGGTKNTNLTISINW